MCCTMLAAPAPTPMAGSRFGSPPNLDMCRSTHCKTLLWSQSPAFATLSPCSTGSQPNRPRLHAHGQHAGIYVCRDQLRHIPIVEGDHDDAVIVGLQSR